MSRNIVQPFIDGTLLPSNSAESADVVNPSTGNKIGVIPVGDAVDADRAVISARRAFSTSSWSESSPSFRKKVLHRMADLIEVHAAELDAMDAQEMGKPVSVGFANAASAAALTRFYA